MVPTLVENFTFFRVLVYKGTCILFVLESDHFHTHMYEPSNKRVLLHGPAAQTFGIASKTAV